MMVRLSSFAKSAALFALFSISCSGQSTSASGSPTRETKQADTACTDDSDCPGGFACNAGAGTCWTNCQDGHLSNVCKNNGEGYVCGGCDDTECVLETSGEPPPTSCTDDSDCPGGFACNTSAGTCWTNCQDGHLSNVCKNNGEGYSCGGCDETECVLR